MEKIIRLLSRGLIALLFIFVLLNWSSVLGYGTYYTWRGLLFTILIVSLVLEIGSYYLKRRCQTPLNGWFYLPPVWMLYFDVIGDTLFLYRDFLWYDQTAHFMGGASVMLVLWQFLRQNKISLKNKGRLFLAWTTTAALGTLYEIEEYTEDLIFKSNRLGDALDTANDLFLNDLGALSMLLAISLTVYLYEKSKAS